MIYIAGLTGPRFTGKDWDEEAGLYYFNARWYDPELGRFITEDPIRDGVNWYGYVDNGPLMFTDPTGLLLQKRDNGFMIDKDEPRDAEIKKEKAEVSEKYGSMTALERWEYHQKLKQDGLGGRWITRKVLTAWNGGAWSQWLDDIRWVPDPRPTEAASGDQEVVAAIMEEELDEGAVKASSRPEERLHYQDVGMPSYGPCLFRALLGLAETHMGKNLTKDEILYARAELSSMMIETSDGLKPVLDLSDGYRVNSYEAIIDWALKVLGSSYNAVRVYTETVAHGSVVYGELSDGNGRHWIEGDGSGVFLWDPSNRARQSNPFKETLSTIYFKFTR